MTLAVALALTSGIAWGAGDFVGGHEARRIGALSVVVWSQLVSGVLLVALLAATVPLPGWKLLAGGAVAGLFGGSALLAFYRGLAIGPMSLVATVSSFAVVVPVLWSLAIGEHPGRIAGAGVAIAIAGIVLVSRAGGGTSPRGPDAAQPARPQRLPPAALALSLCAALGFALFFVTVDHVVGTDTRDALWVTVGARCGSLALLVTSGLASGAVVAHRRRGRENERQRARAIVLPGRRLPWVALTGALDTAANTLFAVATTIGNLAAVAVLASLYPATTVLLARLVLHERLSRGQLAGVLAALAGVALIASG